MGLLLPRLAALARAPTRCPGGCWAYTQAAGHGSSTATTSCSRACPNPVVAGHTLKLLAMGLLLPRLAALARAPTNPRGANAPTDYR
eukprot:scaffold55590_cov72-Phaeocystis_antarctica.AAC.3